MQSIPEIERVCVCVCLTRYYKNTCFTETVVRFKQRGGTKRDRGPPSTITRSFKILIQAQTVSGLYPNGKPKSHRCKQSNKAMQSQSHK